MATQNSDDLTICISELKAILDHNQTPTLLSSHPWMNSLMLAEMVAKDPALREKSAEHQLMCMLSQLFKALMPSSPPRNGKRLDTRWGQFGTLAAQYFAPFVYGTPPPKSLRDTWERIDSSIAMFVFSGQSEHEIEKDKLAQYMVVGNDFNFTPKSTVSDWSRGGIKHLAEVFLQHEQHLRHALSENSQSAAVSPAIDENNVELGMSKKSTVSPRKKSSLRLYTSLTILVIICICIGWAGTKAWYIYTLVKSVENDANALQNISADIIYDQQKMEAVSLNIDRLQKDLKTLNEEIAPFASVGEYFSWIPVYGGDIASAKKLLELATNLTLTAQTSFKGAKPILMEVTISQNRPSPADLLKLLENSQPDFKNAQSFLAQAIAARNAIDPDKLSPKFRDVLKHKIDPLLPLLSDGLHGAIGLPKLLGASANGPQTYLILIQNEDELRPSGGFITAVGTVVIKNGELINYNIESSDLQEDLSKLYPSAPWQLEQYMDSSILVLRDANWYIDFPAAAEWIEYLYAYKHSLSVDGIIAFNQRFVSLLLKITGPVDVPGVSYSITADNVFDYLRDSKVQYATEKPTDRKAFLNDLTQPLLKKLLSGKGLAGKNLLDTFYRGLNQHDLLLQLDDPDFATLLAQHNWDGAIRPGNGDFLMIVDSNIGFNKVNAVIDTRFAYKVDLTNLAAPKSALTVWHHNNTNKDVPCIQWGLNISTDQNYPIQRCYWNYMRVYLPSESRLLDAKPQAIPARAMILQQSVPAQVDILDADDELLNKINIQGFGTLLLVPGKTTIETPFTFSLPAKVVAHLDDSSYTYQLVIHKQPGAASIPLDLQITLPVGAKILSFSQPLQKQNAEVLKAIFDLNEDVTVKIHFK